MARTVSISVVETPEFLSATRKLMGVEGRALLVDYLACNPTVGDLIPGTGGARVIYFYHNVDMPLFALTVFAKNERADLRQQDRNDFQQLTMLLVEAFKRRRKS